MDENDRQRYSPPNKLITLSTSPRRATALSSARFRVLNLLGFGAIDMPELLTGQSLDCGAVLRDVLNIDWSYGFSTEPKKSIATAVFYRRV